MPKRRKNAPKKLKQFNTTSDASPPNSLSSSSSSSLSSSSAPQLAASPFPSPPPSPQSSPPPSPPSLPHQLAFGSKSKSNVDEWCIKLSFLFLILTLFVGAWLSSLSNIQSSNLHDRTNDSIGHNLRRIEHERSIGVIDVNVNAQSVSKLPIKRSPLQLFIRKMMYSESVNSLLSDLKQVGRKLKRNRFVRSLLRLISPSSLSYLEPENTNATTITSTTIITFPTPPPDSQYNLSILQTLNPSHLTLLNAYHTKATTHLSLNPSSYKTRCLNVPLGGPNKSYTYEWTPDDPNLLISYLTVMDWPVDLDTDFPRDCIMLKNKKRCGAENAIEHTLTYRENYKPFNVNPAMKVEGSTGWIYTRGHSVSGNAVVYYRPGTHKAGSSDAYLRNILYTLDRAAGESSIVRTTHRDDAYDDQGTTGNGKYLVIFDCTNFSYRQIPSMRMINIAFGLMNDHYVRRVYKILIVNASKPALILWRVVRPLLIDAVKSKITIVSDRNASLEVLKSEMEIRDIPTWLGGEDRWVYDVDMVMGQGVDWSDDESVEWKSVLPMHLS